MKLRLSICVLTDFDGTITRSDTSHHLVELAIKRNSTKNGDLSHSWKLIQKEYYNNYQKLFSKWQQKLTFLTSNLASSSSSTSLSLFTKFLLEYLWEQEVIDFESMKKVEEAGIFKGISLAEWRKSGTQQVLREEAANVLSSLKEMGVKVGIVSVNWCKDFILGSLKDLSLPPSSICSNQIEDVTLGCFSKPWIVSATDKLINSIQLQNSLLSTCSSLPSSSSQGLTVYIGDSYTDLFSLISADVGIIMGKNFAEISPFLKISPFREFISSLSSVNFQKDISIQEKLFSEIKLGFVSEDLIKILLQKARLVQVESWQEVSLLIKEISSFS